jgi:hypothetical protein
MFGELEQHLEGQPGSHRPDQNVEERFNSRIVDLSFSTIKIALNFMHKICTNRNCSDYR